MTIPVHIDTVWNKGMCDIHCVGQKGKIFIICPRTGKLLPTPNTDSGLLVIFCRGI